MQAIGATTPFFTAFFSLVMLRERETNLVYSSLLPVVIGRVLTPCHALQHPDHEWQQAKAYGADVTLAPDCSACKLTVTCTKYKGTSLCLDAAAIRCC